MAGDVSKGEALSKFSAKWIAISHTAFAASAFGLSLLVGLLLHYRKIVKNEVAGYPQEWFPSVSATIGDWYPERSFFHILIALTSGPRFALVALWYLVTRSRYPRRALPSFVAVCGLLRTFSCGGWVYITSSDDHDWHDVLMVSYIALNLPWMVGSVALTTSRRPLRLRKSLATAFFASLVPLVYLFVEHKVKRVPGAYTRYAFVEWSLIVYDIAFDGVSIFDFADVSISVEQHTAGFVEQRACQSESFKRAGLLAETFALCCQYLADAYLAFVFWTNVTALPLMIFYFAVWDMGLNYDVLWLLANLSPMLLMLKPVHAFSNRFTWLYKVAMIVGMTAYTNNDAGRIRLRLVAFSVAAGFLAYAADWTKAARSGQSRVSTQTFLLGLLLSMLAKHANFSINPAWPIVSDEYGGNPDNGGRNTVALVLAVMASTVVAFRHDPYAGDRQPLSAKKGGALLAGASAGASLFMLHWLFSDAGTIIAWSWTGYPQRGPSAIPHGAITIASFAIGVRLSSASWRPGSPLLLASAVTLYATQDWTSFVGGLGLAVYMGARFQDCLYAAGIHRAGFTWSSAFVTYTALQFFSVLTVAYAFVPGGHVFRERTGTLLAAAVAVLAFGSRSQMVAGGIAARSRSCRRLHHWLSTTSLLAVAIGGVIASWQRLPAVAPIPFHANERILTAGIWCLHFALDGRMMESQRRVADFIEAAEVDVFGLLESDLQRITTGSRDFTQWAAHSLGMYADIGPGPNKHTWGAALLSKFPIVNSTHHLLPSPGGELAPAIHATLNVYGEMVDVVVAHNGQEEDPLDRQLQSQELARIMREAQPRPLLFLGYVVTKPHAPKPSPYQYLIEDGDMLDIEASDLDRWCEYILYRGLTRIGYARLNRGARPAITDTEVQLGKFIVPFAKASNRDVERRAGKSAMPVAHRFPSLFEGQGWRGHYYHVLMDEDGNRSPHYYTTEGSGHGTNTVR